jgi:spermidine synthase
LRNPTPQSPLPLLFVLAGGSGLAALIYEIVWFQFLELYIGSSAVSLGVLLATFMGGTCLGSLCFARFVPSRFHSLRVYALIEIGIAAFGLLMLVLVPLVGHVYTTWSGYGLRGFLLRGIVAGVCLLPPTLLMGATLPALARRLQTIPDRVSSLGLLYAANILGAVFGCLVSGFYLLREYDVVTATYIAAAVNCAIAAMAFLMADSSTHSPASDRPPDQPAAGSFGTWDVYAVIALSGFCALAAEAIWTRILGLLLGASVYTFSIILSVFLAGLGIGSTIGTLVGRSFARPKAALAWCQLIGAAAIAWTAYSLSASMPYWPINPAISSSIWYNFQLDINRTLWALLPPTLVWGASFPLALAAASSPSQDAARLMARVYAANTVGAIGGAVLASLFFVSWAGSQDTQRGLIALSTVSGILVLSRERLAGRVTAMAAAAVLSGLLIYCVPPLPALLVAHGRYAAAWVDKTDIVYAQEGLNASVAVSTHPDGGRTFHVAGKVQASNAARDMRLQRMLGHLTTLTAAAPRSVLVIGCGAGITAGAVSIDPRVQRVTIVEIEPLVPNAAAAYFSKENFDVLKNPRVEVRIDDGRHYLLTTAERFDAVTADPLDPWVKGAANLYTKEFFEAVKGRLNPGGIVTVYIQLFETNTDAVKSAVATFFEVFPQGTVWGNTYEGKGHDMVLLGQVEPLRIDLDEMDRRLTSPDYSRVSDSLREVGMGSSIDLFATYAGQGADLGEWLQGAAINRDQNLRMQYLAGFGLNLDDSASIYADLLTHRRFPDPLFISSEGRVETLRKSF